MTDRGRGTFTHMLAVAKKKPYLKEILDNIDSYTIEELDTVKGQPAWVRKHLVAHKKELTKREQGYLTPEEIAVIMIKKSQ